jgi:hypothetical protein
VALAQQRCPCPLETSKLDLLSRSELAGKAGPILDLYQRIWEGVPLGPMITSFCADEKNPHSYTGSRQLARPEKGSHAQRFLSLQELQQRLLAFQSHYERSASPFNWTFTRRDLHALLAKIAVTRLAPAAWQNTSP